MESGRNSSFIDEDSSSFRSNLSLGSAKVAEIDDTDLQCAAMEIMPTSNSLIRHIHGRGDSPRLGAKERHEFIENLIKNVKEDNRQMLERMKKRIDKVGVKLPTIEVRYKNLSVDASCEIVHGKPLPSLWNTTMSALSGFARLCGLNAHEAKKNIIRDASGVIKPSRMTLLLGPPGCGKTTLLLALAGKIGQSLKVTGDISYNGSKLEEFFPEKTSSYISQHDLHIPQMTVRETLDFSARCQGVGSREDILMEVKRREKTAGVVPESDIDTYMKEVSAKGLEKTLQTDYVMKILGLDNCSDIRVGDAMRRGISGGQRRRLTTGYVNRSA